MQILLFVSYVDVKQKKRASSLNRQPSRDSDDSYGDYNRPAPVDPTNYDKAELQKMYFLVVIL